MDKKSVAGITLTLLLIGVLTFEANVQPVKAEPRTWIVDDDGPADFHTIQEAIDAASDGDTIFVYNGTYEPIVVDKALSLEGENKSITIIVGTPSNPYFGTVSVLVSGVNVSGFAIRNSLKHGIALEGTWKTTLSGITISNNFLSDCTWGISLTLCDRVIIADNIVTRTKIAGIECSHSTKCQIINNTITNNLGYGILDMGKTIWFNHELVDVPVYNSICNNTITCNHLGIGVNAINDTLRNNVMASNIEAGIEIGMSHTIFHNSFFNKKQVAYVWGVNVWDDGYPSGGNYWSDYPYGDEFSGPGQDQPGSDGIGDEPCVIDENNRDQYPFMTPFLLFGHDLVGSIWAPDSLTTGTSTTLEATVYNLGLHNESDVELELRVNDVVVGSEVISKLPSGSFFVLNYSWTPTVEGLYNITSYVIPVPSELTTLNNIVSTIVNVYTPPTEPTQIYLSPSEIQATIGSVVTIDVMVANVEDLFLWQIKLYFDNTMLKCTEDMVWYPEDHVFAGKSILPVTPVVWEDADGWYITFACTLVGAETTFYGTGTLCKINFTCIAVGTSTLTFDMEPLYRDTFLWDYELEFISFTVTDGEVTVAYITGDLNVDGRVDMKDIATAALAFGSYPTHPRWNPTCDLNGDNKIDLKDIGMIAKNFGKTIP